jgi:AbrB family looped-hinge helix DNA binding protein
MSCVTVSSKGQVVIPAELRRALGIEAGSQVEVNVVDGKLQIELRHPAHVSTHEAGYGMLKYRGPARRLADADVADLMRRAHGEK